MARKSNRSAVATLLTSLADARDYLLSQIPNPGDISDPNDNVTHLHICVNAQGRLEGGKQAVRDFTKGKLPTDAMEMPVDIYFVREDREILGTTTPFEAKALAAFQKGGKVLAFSANPFTNPWDPTPGGVQPMSDYVAVADRPTASPDGPADGADSPDSLLDEIRGMDSSDDDCD